MITVEEVKNNEEVQQLIKLSNRNLEVLGFTEHGTRHLTVISERAGKLLRELGYPERKAQLVEIAGWLHDIGYIVNIIYHQLTGAIIAADILRRMGMNYTEIYEITLAIGNHHEGEGEPVSDISAALILADKSDVHKSRVRSSADVMNDIHDRVNFAATDSHLTLGANNSIVLSILIDPDISSVMEYFKIFLVRMEISKKAANLLGKNFELIINGIKLT